jgi:putative component of membrane protein insertase Oxa1/YidC/SpoIIIJ protein YidD
MEQYVIVVFAMSGKARRFSPTLSKYICQSIEN